MKNLFLLLSLFLSVLILSSSVIAADEFVGPMTTWTNIKTVYGAKGDGKTDDTRAIQTAFDSLRMDNNKQKVLYFPAGTYRITSPVRLVRVAKGGALGTSIFGEDPATTIIRYEGPVANQVFEYNAWYSSINRLTLDGQGKAFIGLDHGDAFGCANQFSDLVIKNVEIGMNSNRKDGHSETTILRCKFINCTKFGFYCNNFNTLDFWFWYCTFENCGVGLYNEAGNFHAYYCLFKNSKETDVYLNNTTGWGLRYNYSIGSKMFLKTKAIAYADGVALQGNIILDCTGDYVVDNQRPGSLTFLDNIIRTTKEKTGPCIRSVSDVISIGNIWSVVKPFEVAGRLYTQDDTSISQSTKMYPEPKMPEALPHIKRIIVEVSPNADGSEIQKAIAKAVASKDEKPVVYIHEGVHSIKQTLVVPANREIQIVGAGIENGTTLKWNGAANLPVVRLAGPSRATLRNLRVQSDTSLHTDCILIDNADQPGSRVFAEYLNSNYHSADGLLAEGLKNALVEIHGCDGGSHIEAIGPGVPNTSRVCSFGNNAGYFAVSKLGNLLVTDLYSEINGKDPVLVLNDAGTFTLDNGVYKHTLSSNGKSIVLNNFNGKASFLGVTLIDLATYVEGDGSGSNLLMAGCFFSGWNEKGYSGPWYSNVSQKAHSALLLTNTAGKDPTAISKNDQGAYSSEWVREMYFATRSIKPQNWPLVDVPKGATDVRLFRVQVGYGLNGVHVVAKSK